MPIKVCVYGAGGHAKVVLQSLFRLGYVASELSIYDDCPSKDGTELLGVSVTADGSICSGRTHVAIGTNPIRQQVFDKLKLQSYESIIDPASVVSDFSELSQGVYVAAGAIIGPSSRIGQGCIINHNVVVDHDVTLGRICHIAPSATILGGCSLGDRVFLGSGCTVLPGVTICDDVTVGAGATVVKDIINPGVYIGTPAQIKNNE